MKDMNGKHIKNHWKLEVLLSKVYILLNAKTERVDSEHWTPRRLDSGRLVLDSGRLDSGRLDAWVFGRHDAWTLGLWTPGHFNSERQDT